MPATIAERSAPKSAISVPTFELALNGSSKSSHAYPAVFIHTDHLASITRNAGSFNTERKTSDFASTSAGSSGSPTSHGRPCRLAGRSESNRCRTQYVFASSLVNTSASRAQASAANRSGRFTSSPHAEIKNATTNQRLNCISHRPSLESCKHPTRARRHNCIR